MRHSIQNFLQDRRGAIAVLSTLMASVLVGMTWYTMGTGDAILYRERLQDASDASVYAAAVYHARGMNIIAMFNIIMAAIIAILIILKIMMVFGKVLQALFFIPFIGGALATAGKFLDKAASTAADIVQNVANKVIPLLAKAQVGVRGIMPIAAEAKAIFIAKDYKAPVQLGIMVSSTIMNGLPVTEDVKSRICEKAAGYVATAVTGFIPSIGRPFAKGVIEKLLTFFGGYFCGDQGSMPDLGGDLAADQCKEAEKGNKEKTACSDRQTACAKTYTADMAVAKDPNAKAKAQSDQTNCNQTGACSRAEARPGHVNPDGTVESPAVKNFNKDKCAEDAKKQINVTAGLGNPGGKEADGRPMKVGLEKQPKEKIGNGFSPMQVYSISFGDTKSTERAKSGIQVADWGRGSKGSTSIGSALGPTLGKFSFARAEFYFDCNGLWDEKSCNGGDKGPNAENAMWSLNWRARLRRVTSKTLVGPDLGNLTQVLGRVEGALQGEFISSPSDLVSGMSGAACQQLPAMCGGGGGGGGILGLVTGQLDGVVQGLVTQVLDSAGSQAFLDQASQIAGTVNGVEDSVIKINSALMGGAVGVMH